MKTAVSSFDHMVPKCRNELAESVFIVLFNFEQRYNAFLPKYYTPNYETCPRYRPTWPRGVQEVRAPRFLDTPGT